MRKQGPGSRCQWPDNHQLSGINFWPPDPGPRPLFPFRQDEKHILLNALLRRLGNPPDLLPLLQEDKGGNALDVVLIGKSIVALLGPVKRVESDPLLRDACLVRNLEKARHLPPAVRAPGAEKHER